MNPRVIRSLPFLWMHMALFDVVKPSYKGILAYTALAYYAHGDRGGTGTTVALKDLAKIVNVSEDTIRRGLAELVKLQAIQIRPRWKELKGKKRQQIPNDYVLVDLTAPVPI